MYSLDGEARKRQLFDFLYRAPDGVLRRYRVPEHYADDELRAEVMDLVQDIDDQIPNKFNESDFSRVLPGIRRALRKRHGPPTWPPAKTFIAATKDAVSAVNFERAKEPTANIDQDWDPDSLKNIAARMRAGDAVPEHILFGEITAEMLSRNLITPITLDAYRSGALAARTSAYGREEADRWFTEVMDQTVFADAEMQENDP